MFFSYYCAVLWFGHSRGAPLGQPPRHGETDDKNFGEELGNGCRERWQPSGCNFRYGRMEHQAVCLETRYVYTFRVSPVLTKIPERPDCLSHVSPKILDSDHAKLLLHFYLYKSKIQNYIIILEMQEDLKSCHVVLNLMFFSISAAEVVISLIQMYEANYPEILKACYIINGKLYLYIYVLSV